MLFFPNLPGSCREPSTRILGLCAMTPLCACTIACTQEVESGGEPDLKTSQGMDTQDTVVVLDGWPEGDVACEAQSDEGWRYGLEVVSATARKRPNQRHLYMQNPETGDVWQLIASRVKKPQNSIVYNVDFSPIGRPRSTRRIDVYRASIWKPFSGFTRGIKYVQSDTSTTSPRVVHTVLSQADEHCFLPRL